MSTRGVNMVILIGNAGNDPDMRYTANGGAVCNLSLATTDSWRDKQSGENQERTEWHRVVLFGKLGEIAGEYVRKGAKLYIEGRLQTRKWQDKSGQDRYTTEIVANEMQMLDSRSDGNVVTHPASQQPPRQQAPAQQQSAPPHQPYRQPAQAAGGGGSIDGFDEDIPFSCFGFRTIA